LSGLLLDLGRQDYGRTWALQRALVMQREQDNVPDLLLLVEHDHVITVGRRGAELPSNLPLPVYWVERGGMATYHGPGQLVGYPILKLTQRGLSVKGYLRLLEQALIRSVASLGIEAYRIEGHTGVWVAGRKVASIGVAVRNWVTYHGFALNVNADLSYFRLISPCGLDPSVMTTLQGELGRPLTVAEVKPPVIKSLQEELDMEFRPTSLDTLLSAGEHGPLAKAFYQGRGSG